MCSEPSKAASNTNRHCTNDFNFLGRTCFVVLVGLASKNAILVVEFARDEQKKGKSIVDAVLAACLARLRPIVMTSFAFILGVVPLMLGHGAGAEMRATLGVAVFSGMLGVTMFGLVLTPIFYYVIIGTVGGPKTAPTPPPAPPAAPAAPAAPDMSIEPHR